MEVRSDTLPSAAATDPKIRRSMIMELRTGRTRPVAPGSLLMSSGSTGWKGFLLEEYRTNGFHIEEICCLHHMVFLQMESSVTLEWQAQEGRELLKIQPGQVSIVPAFLPHSVQGHGNGRILAVAIETEFLSCAAVEYGSFQKIELRSIHGLKDPLLKELILSLRAEVENNSDGSDLYADSLATMLAVHLVRKYSTTRPMMSGFRGGLSRHQLRKIIEFVRDHLAGSISLQELASLADLSPYHFARQFKRSTGLAPYEYVTQCRALRAKELLLTRFGSLADVAIQSGFCDQSHLTRHFKKIYGVTPASFARRASQRKTEAAELR